MRLVRRDRHAPNLIHIALAQSYLTGPLIYPPSVGRVSARSSHDRIAMGNGQRRRDNHGPKEQRDAYPHRNFRLVCSCYTPFLGRIKGSQPTRLGASVDGATSYLIPINSGFPTHATNPNGLI